jgi:hypothetical protein
MGSSLMQYRNILLVLAGAGLAAGLLPVFTQNRPAAQVPMPQGVVFRVLFGLTDKEPAVWDGKVAVSAGKVLSVRGWRFGGKDSTDGTGSWKASTRYSPGTNGPGPVLETGILLTISGEDTSAEVRVETPKGSFSFRPQDVPWGTGTLFLDRQARVDRVGLPVQLTDSVEEQDFPAMAQNGDDVWVSYVEFVHGDRSKAVNGQFSEAPKDFDFLARPVGGDQVWLLRYSKSQRVWSAPVAASGAGLDVMRTAVAVDGKNRVWVIWAADKDGNFDIYARAYSDGKWSAEQRITSDAGTDLNPVAATDNGGRVWLAWQGYRNGNLEILASALNGDAFTVETMVSTSPASDWDPAIAAGPGGEVAVAWDTYDKGDYDVVFRRLRYEREVSTGPVVPVASGSGFDARPSVSYDPQGRLWVAWESSDTRWGKDYGAYSTTGIALYQGHTVKVRCFVGNDSFETTAALTAVLPAAPSAGSYGQGKLGAPTATIVQPDPSLAAKRKPNGGPGAPSLPRNSFPRVWTDQAGTVYLAFRNSSGARGGPGTVWYEQLVYFDGAKWNGPYPIPNSDGLLDNRPVAAALAAGNLLVVTATDHRQSTTGRPLPGTGDTVNTDLYAAEYKFAITGRSPALKTVVDASGAADPGAEAAQVSLMRNYRVQVGSDSLQPVRGDFHRHTEISADGGSDGPLIDAYRYTIDAAGMDWSGCCDHDNGGSREYSWWLEQKHNDAYRLEGRFVPMFAYERSVVYPEGHRNVMFARRGIRPLPRMKVTAPDSAPTPAPDTQMLYRYLRQFKGVANSHTSGTDMGTDWRDNDASLEPEVEIYQGDRQNYEIPGAPRSNSAGDSIGGWRPLGFVSLALDKGYRLGFQSSSDHISTHMSYAVAWVREKSRDGILEAFLKRRVYGATDNILADVRCSGHFMGEEFALAEAPVLSVKLAGTSNFARVFVVKDGKYVFTIEPNARTVEFTWRDNGAVPGRTSYYYVRGEQDDGELVWASPMWITVR